jgi:hypothetical protein
MPRLDIPASCPMATHQDRAAGYLDVPDRFCTTVLTTAATAFEMLRGCLLRHCKTRHATAQH